MPGHLLWLALANFAIGTEGFLIVGLLPTIATDLHVSPAEAGYLVTAFALAYAIGSPLLATLTGNVERRRLLIALLALFALSNLVAAASTGYFMLMGARVLLALSAGLFVPATNAVAASLVPPGRRARAIALVAGGLSVAVALGVPIGTLIGTWAGWRTAFLLVAALSAIALCGLLFLPSGLAFTPSSLAERAMAVRRPLVLPVLAVTVAWSIAGFLFFVFLAILLTDVAGLPAAYLELGLFVYGAFAAIGSQLGGQLADRIGLVSGQRGLLTTRLLAYLAFALLALTLAPGVAATILLTALLIPIAAASWAFHPAQAARLIGLAPDVAPVLMSLNSSALYAGAAMGSALGSWIIAVGAPLQLCLAAVAADGLALILLAASVPRRRQPAFG